MFKLFCNFSLNLRQDVNYYVVDIRINFHVIFLLFRKLNKKGKAEQVVTAAYVDRRLALCSLQENTAQYNNGIPLISVFFHNSSPI